MLLLLSACGGRDADGDDGNGSGNGAGPAATPSPGVDPALRDVVWRAVSIDGEPLPADAEVTMSLANGGRAGCNLYSATFKLGPGDAFHADLGEMTLMGCEAELMRIEERFVTALGNATTYALSENNSELILRDGQGGELRFTRQET